MSCLRSNLSSTVKVELCHDELTNGKRVFKRMYLCLVAYKKGWKIGCGLIIGIDACFLKTRFKSKLLVALGRDEDEQTYSIAWAYVRSETKVS